MIDQLEKAFAVTGVLPHIICSGHVHNYQRYSKHYNDDAVVRYLVSGAGGYADLHTVAAVGDERVHEDARLFEQVELVTYCDNRKGFLKIRLDRAHKEILMIDTIYTSS